MSISFNAINFNNNWVGFEFNNTIESYAALYNYSIKVFAVKPKDGFMLQFANHNILILYSNNKISYLLYQNNDIDNYYISPSMSKNQINNLFIIKNNIVQI